MVLKKGDFVKINFTGKIKETGEIFDTTYQDVAKKHGLYDPKIIFKARPVVIGARHVLPGIDKKLVGSDLGDKNKIHIEPVDGFGLRDPSKIRVIPLREFKKKGVDPLPGMRLEIDDNVGRVQSVNGGRVRIDLNHGLAGKVLEYEVKVEEKTNKIEEKIRQLLELYLSNVDSQEFGITRNDKVIEVVMPESLKVDPAAPMGKISAVRDVFTFLDGIDQVVFKEVYQRMGSPSSKKPSKKTRSKKAKKGTSKASSK